MQLQIIYSIYTMWHEIESISIMLHGPIIPIYTFEMLCYFVSHSTKLHHVMETSTQCLSLQFGALTPLEPRLSKKLMEPLISLIHSTTAMSLLYECISTVIAGMPNHTASIQVTHDITMMMS